MNGKIIYLHPKKTWGVIKYQNNDRVSQVVVFNDGDYTGNEWDKLLENALVEFKLTPSNVPQREGVKIEKIL